jgi:hypothetical protein
MAQPAVPPLPWQAPWGALFHRQAGIGPGGLSPPNGPKQRGCRRSYLGGARDDSPTFAAERYAHRLPKASDEQERAPRLAIQQAVVQAARVPLSDLPAAVGPSLGPGTDLSRQGGG